MAVIATLGRQQWVLGMEWSSYTSIPKRDDLLKDAGRDDDGELVAPWYALRVTDEVMQAGFCAPVGDITRPKKLASLAAMVADARPQPWLGIFELADDLYWYVAVRDEYAVLPGGDVVGNRETVEAALAEHAGYGGWNREEGNARTLEKLLEEVKAKRTRVRSLAVSRIDPVPTAIAAVVAMIAVGVGVGIHAYKAHQHQLMVEAAKKRQQNMPVEHIPDAGEYLVKSPAPSQWLSVCHDALASLTPSMHGWVSKSAGCSDDTLTIVWSRGPGATVSYAPPGVIDESGDMDTQTVRIPRPVVLGDNNAATLQSARIALVAWGQRYGAKVKIGSPQSLSDKAAVGYSVPVTIPMPLSPFEPGNGLDDIPGLRIKALTPTQTKSDSGDSEPGSSWTITGVLYAHQ